MSQKKRFRTVKEEMDLCYTKAMVSGVIAIICGIASILLAVFGG